MSDWDDDQPKEAPTPEDLCRQAFSRCSNWPEDRLGQQGLFMGLSTAATRFSVTQDDLVAKCRETSAFCPTDADLLRVAHEIDAERQRRTRGMAPWLRLPKCDICSDSGWAVVGGKGEYIGVKRCPNGCEVPDQARFTGGA